jgi:hypothetical protein
LDAILILFPDQSLIGKTSRCGGEFHTIATGSTLSEVQESTNVAREASFFEAKAQHLRSTGIERRCWIIMVAGKRCACRNW